MEIQSVNIFEYLHFAWSWDGYKYSIEKTTSLPNYGA